MQNKTFLNQEHRAFLRHQSDVIFIYLFMFLMCAVVALSEKSFLSAVNIRNVINASVSLCAASFGQLIIVLLGGVDLSVGAIISAANVICASLMTDTPYGWVAAVVVSLAFGLVAGLCNGLLVAKANQQAIIATLATSTIISGIALLIMPTPGGYIHSGFAKFMNRGCSKLMPLICILAMSILIWLLLNRTSFGRQLFVVGGNEQAAKSVGIRTERVKLLAFVLAGAMSALAGIFISTYITSGDPVVGSQYSQRTITAAVVGGASLAGGKGSVVGCLAGVLIIGIINNMLNLLGVSSYYQYISQGIVLIIALALGAIKTKR